MTTNAVSDLEQLVDVLRREARLVTVANFRLGVLYDLLCDALDADEPPTAEAYAAADAAEQVLARLRREELHRALVTAGLGLTLGLGAEPSLADLAQQQQMMLHLDFEVTDLEAEVARAVALGATVASYQPQEDVRVLLDPAGHPFCLYT